MAAPAPGSNPRESTPRYRHVRTGSSISGGRAGKSAIPLAVFNVLFVVLLVVVLVVIAQGESGDRERRGAAGEYAERVVEGRRLKMQFRSTRHGTEILLQSRSPCRGVSSRRRRDGTQSLPQPVLRIGPLGPVAAEGCSRKWSACPINTGRSTAT